MNQKNIKEFNKLINSSPQLFFSSVEPKMEFLTEIIYKEYLDWQNAGGKIKDHNIIIFGDKKDIVSWRFGKERYACVISPFAPFKIEQYKLALDTVFSFMEDRPQYYKYSKMDGMFNPLNLLLYKFLI